MSSAQVEALLYELCVTLGFCLSPDERRGGRTGSVFCGREAWFATHGYRRVVAARRRPFLTPKALRHKAWGCGATSGQGTGRPDYAEGVASKSRHVANDLTPAA